MRARGRFVGVNKHTRNDIVLRKNERRKVMRPSHEQSGVVCMCICMCAHLIVIVVVVPTGSVN